MAIPAGAEIPIYASPYKGAGEVRVYLKLDKPIADANFVDEFAGAALDVTKWSSWQPANTTITEAGGKLTLASTASTNGFPVVQSIPGKTFPSDPSIGWTLDWTMDFPVLTGYGVFFRVCDLENNAAIVAIKNNSGPDNYQVFMPDWPEGAQLETLGAGHTASHDYSLVYTPGSPGQYELFRDTVSKGTLSSLGRQAWYIVIGNGSVQVGKGDWTSIAVSRVAVTQDSLETQVYPDWATPVAEADGNWSYIPHVLGVKVSAHKRNDVDTAVIDLAEGAYVTGVNGGTGLAETQDLTFTEYDWLNREVHIDSRQSDGVTFTAWKEIFRGLCDMPQVTEDGGTVKLSITIRDKVRRMLQMYHGVRGYSDSGTAIAGVQMNLDVQHIIEDLCATAGLAAAEYSVAALALKPRTFQVLGTSFLDAITDLADQAVLVVERNCGANPGRMDIVELTWGTDTPVFLPDVDHDVILLDYAETDMGLTAQVVETVQHSEFGEFSDIYPLAPVPPFAGVIRHNATIAQAAVDINSTRLLPFLRWRQSNRELNSIVIRMVGQDWIAHDIETRVISAKLFGASTDDTYIIDGWEYDWTPSKGFLTTIHLVNQHPERAIRRACLDRTVQAVY
jgi:hypothetical protein